MGKSRSAASVRDRYRGKTATEYEKSRANCSKWDKENEAVDTFLGTIDAGSHICDIPVGTGRYFSSYIKYGHRVTACDTSPDMLEIAQRTFGAHRISASYKKHDVLQPLPQKFSAVVCTRLLNHFTQEEAALAMQNLLDAAPVVILGLREPRDRKEPNWHRLTDLVNVDKYQVVGNIMGQNENSTYVMYRISHVG